MHELILGDRGIRKAIEDGTLKFDPMPDEEQFQPTTVDLRLGTVRVYDAQSTAANAKRYNQLLENIISDHGVEAGIREIDARLDEMQFEYQEYTDTNAYIPSGAMFEVYPRERISYDASLSTSFELRSSRGRMVLRPNSFSMRKEDGRHYIQTVNENPNDIILPANSKFMQLFVHPSTPAYAGRRIRGLSTLMNIFPDNYVTQNAEILFNVDEVSEFRKLDEPYVAGKKYDNLFETTKMEDAPIQLKKDTAYLIKLSPEVDTRDLLGIRLLRTLPQSSLMPGELIGQNQTVCAGWVDPGYSGPISAHYSGRIDRTIKPGDLFAAGAVYGFLPGTVSNVYGSEVLNSHYADTTDITSQS